MTLKRRLDKLTGSLPPPPPELTEEEKAEQARERAHIASMEGGDDLLAAMDAAPDRDPIKGVLWRIVSPRRPDGPPCGYAWKAAGDTTPIFAKEDEQ